MIMHPTRATLLSRAVLLTGLLLFLSLVAIGQTVYVTNTGSKYHKDGCRYLSQSKIATSYDKALEGGYTACSVCKPSASATTVSAVETEVPLQKNVTSIQCSATTKA